MSGGPPVGSFVGNLAGCHKLILKQLCPTLIHFEVVLPITCPQTWFISNDVPQLRHDMASIWSMPEQVRLFPEFHKQAVQICLGE